MIFFSSPFTILRPKRNFKRNQFLCQFISLYSSSSVQSLDISVETNIHCPDDAEFKSVIQNLARSGAITKALQTFRLMKTAVPGKPTVYDYNALINCYLKSENVELRDLSTLYAEMKTLGLNPNASTFNTFLKGLNLLGESKIALWVTIQMCNHAFTPSFSSLSNLLKKSLNSVDLENAVKVLELMMALNYIPTESQVISLINRISKQGMTEKACFVFIKLLEKDYFPTPYIYNPILWSLCKSDQINPSLAFFCFLEKKGFVHNACSYTALFYGLCKKGLFKEASNCLNKIATDSHCYPNVRTYTIIIKCLCDNGRIQEVLCLLAQMEKRGLDPDIVTYNIILRAFSNQNMDLEDILGLFNTIHDMGISKDRYTVTALSGLIKKGDKETAHDLLRSVILDVNDMDVAAYNVWFSCLISCVKSKMWFSEIKSMRKKGIEPNNTTLNTILKGFCRRKTLNESLKYLQTIKWPDIVSFNTLLSAACKKGDSVMVKRVIDLMEGEGFELNVVGLTCLMEYYYNVGKIEYCLDVFERMLCDGPHPSIVTVNSLVSGLCKNQQLEAAYKLFCSLESYDLSSDSRTYKILINACKNEENGDLEAELLKKCREEGVKLDD